jgi:NADPH-dependent 7-cyano-7-deazaguanine reductase QueF
MPSPFPGMDPYLEGEMWQEFHERLANEISAQLLPKLAPKYVALLAKRYVIHHVSTYANDGK